MANQFCSGVVTLKVVNDNRTLYPLSFNYSENINTVCSSFSFSLSKVGNNYIIPIYSTEVRVYIDDVFFYGGFFQKFSESETSYNYTFIGYGYQINKSYMINRTTVENNEMSLSNFIYTTIRNNIAKSVKYIPLIQTAYDETINPKELKIDKTFSTKLTGYYKQEETMIKFYIYDPFGYGTAQVGNLVSALPEDIDKSKIIEYLSFILKKGNLYLRCIGKYSDLTEAQRTFIYPKDNNLDDNAYILLIWAIRDDAENPYGYQYIFNRERITSVSNKIKMFNTASDYFGFKMADKLKQSTKVNPEALIYDEEAKSRYISIADVIYDTNNRNSSNVISYPTRSVNIENLCGDYLVIGQEKYTTDNDGNEIRGNLETTIRTSIMDGTIGIKTYSKDSQTKNIKYQAMVDINKESISALSFNATVIGAVKGLTIGAVMNGNQRNDKPFWSTNQLVNFKTSEYKINVKLLIDQLNIDYTPNDGLKTSLRLVPPQSYSCVKYDFNTVEQEIERIIKKDEAAKELKNLPFWVKFTGTQIPYIMYRDLKLNTIKEGEDDANV